jgi:putative drug exporter of the RND superfamily
MFNFLGQVVRRAWGLLLAGWIVLLLATWYAAPAWSSVTLDQEFAFLPADAPSRQADELLSKAFPHEKTASNIVLVLHRADDTPTFKQTLLFIEQVLEPGLRQIAESEGGLAYEVKHTDEPLFGDESPMPPPPEPTKRSPIALIRTPNAPSIGALLVSPDRRAMLVDIELVPSFMSHANWPIIDQINALLAELRQQGKIPAGLDIAMTGSAVVGRDQTMAELRSVRATGLLTVVLVLVLLLFIYRAPLLAFIPLVTVYMAVQLSLHLLSILAKYGDVKLFEGIQIYITILAYGAGVDYCLFLTARYKEELDAGASPADAVARAIGGVGAALVASAATVMCGIAMMMFAEFGKFRQAGFAIPLSLLLVLCATLTFSTALLRMAGRWAFWPYHQPAPTGARPKEPSSGEQPAVLGGSWLERIWGHMGQLLLRKAGRIWLITAALMAPFAILAGLLHNHLSYDLIGNLPSDASSVAGTKLLEKHFPGGMIGPISVLLINPNLDFRSDEGRALIEKLTDQLRSQKQELGLADVRSFTAPLGITAAAHEDFSGELPPEALAANAEGIQKVAQKYYLTDMGGRTPIGTRLELLFDSSPFSHSSIEKLERVEQVVRDSLPAQQRAESQLHFSGTTASVRDLAMVMQRDRKRIDLLVVAAVFLILVILLRQFVIPVYLLLSVLFSYYTTLGVTFAVWWLLDPAGFTGIDWKVAIFLFTILIAVGEDYNIFLMTRVKEETQRYGPVRGITEALDRTGPIISSCGIVMAGTFASLLAGSLVEMKQLGFALAFGVLLDTFVVRPILVPAFLILLHSDRLPLLFRSRQERQPAETPSTQPTTPAR